MQNTDITDSILDAVNRVVSKKGLVGTTIDAVAAEAGVSKGGVLYYFPNKQNLLLAMIDRYEATFSERREKYLEKYTDSPKGVFKATVELMLADIEELHDDIPNMATVLDDPELRRRVGELKRTMFKELSRDLAAPDAVATVLYLVDALWMNQRFSPPVVPKTIRNQVIKRLWAIVEEA